MITPPERSAARDEMIDRMLPYVGELGWNGDTLRRVAGADAALLFPGGAADMVEAYIDLTDRRMVAAAAPMLANLRLPQRVRTIIATRLAMAQDHKAAARRAALVLAQPGNARLAATTLARTVDAIWHAAGDRSADMAWYSKRAILAGVYSATLLYWMNTAVTEEAALGFLDRRLAGVARFTRFSARVRGMVQHSPST